MNNLTIAQPLIDDSGWSQEFAPPSRPMPIGNRLLTASSPESIDSRPAIRLPGDGLLISQFATELGSHLAEAGIYSRKGYATAVAKSGQEFELVTSSWLRSWIEHHVVPFKVIGNHDIRINRSMSDDVARAVLASPQFLEALPEVEGLNPCPMPVIRADGSLEILSPGVDVPSKTYTADPGFELELMPHEEATRIVRELLREFAWAEDNGRSMGVHLAAMLTVFARGVVPAGTHCPVFIYAANAEGAGKTLLASLAGVGYPSVAGEAAPTTEEEWQKKLLALTISGRRLVLIDNCKGEINSPSLEAYTTATTYRGRILGTSREFEGDAGATVLITGNDVDISGDLRRRSLFVELFMPELRAEARRYDRILDQYAIRAMRPRILSALWSIVHGWDVAGRPPSSLSNSSFPRWCALIGGIVEHAGFACPVQPANLESMGDTDTRDFERLAECMDQDHEYTFEGLANTAKHNGFFEKALRDRDYDDNLTRRSKAIFSKIIKRYSRRRVSASATFQIEGSGHSKRYVIRVHGQHGSHANPDQ